MTSEDIIREIKHNGFNNRELNAIAQAITFARGQLTHEVKQDLRRGVRVYFNDKYGHRVTGIVESVKIKKAIVGCGNIRYNVPINMLEFS